MSACKGQILLVEHRAEVAELIADRLQRRGFQVQTTPHPTPLTEDVDVVLCDIATPGISWDTVLQSLRHRQFEATAIMLSSDTDQAQVMTALRLGFNDFFTLPIDDWEALFTSLDRCMAQRSLQRENQANRRRLEGSVRILEQDQQAGRHVQMRMLPESPQQLGQYVFSHTVIPSLYLSGDFTDYFLVGDRHACFVIADVSGHGSSSAFVTVLLKNLFARKRSDFIHRGDDSILHPPRMVAGANYDLLELAIGKYATMVVGVIDLEQNTLRYCVAGHLPLPVLVADGSAVYLPGEGPAAGIMEDAGYTEFQRKLPNQFTLALFTDGILEILPADKLVDKERYFLQVFSSTVDTPEQVVLQLGLDKVKEAPDDIAALFIGRGG